MAINVPFGTASAREIYRRECQTPTKMSVNNFGKHAKLAWPFKTAAVLAAIASEGKPVPTTQRTAERWLSGEFEPPNIVLVALMAEITKR